jgi:hypothetical protein
MLLASDTIPGLSHDVQPSSLSAPGATPSGTALPDVALKLGEQGEEDQLEDQEVTRVNLKVGDWMGSVVKHNPALSDIDKPPSTNLCLHRESYRSPVLPATAVQVTSVHCATLL